MRVIIEQTVFDEVGETSALPLLEFFALASDERHTLLTKPLYSEDETGQPLARWLARFPKPLKKLCESVLMQGQDRASTEPPDTAQCRVVARGPSDWKRSRLCIADALRLLRTPLRLLLENRRNDYEFLLRLAPPARREELQQAVADGWIEIAQGGGLGEIKKLLKELITAPAGDLRARVERLRLWVMFDRDSDPEDRSEPSPTSKETAALCGKSQTETGDPWSLPFVQLSRRSVENYIPIRLLERWADRGSGRERDGRRKRVAALARLTPTARWQYNMKHGLLGDVSGSIRREIQKEKNSRELIDGDLDPLFRGLSREDRRLLTTGFGADIASLFHAPLGIAEASREHWFLEEYQRGPSTQPDRAAILEGVFARL